MIPKNFEGIKILANMACNCTDNQKIGFDPSICKSCYALATLNYIKQIKKDIVEEMFGRKYEL